MYSLIVLGDIPGTNIQITFLGWLWFMTLLAIAVMAASHYHLFQHILHRAKNLQQDLPSSQLGQPVSETGHTVEALPGDTAFPATG